jgi:hypothetical protein
MLRNIRLILHPGKSSNVFSCLSYLTNCKIQAQKTRINTLIASASDETRKSVMSEIIYQFHQLSALHGDRERDQEMRRRKEETRLRKLNTVTYESKHEQRYTHVLLPPRPHSIPQENPDSIDLDENMEDNLKTSWKIINDEQ